MGQRRWAETEERETGRFVGLCCSGKKRPEEEKEKAPGRLGVRVLFLFRNPFPFLIKPVLQIDLKSVQTKDLI